ncbi:MAG: class I SAM-dependent methyltransferase [Desulfurivibrio sp.]|nr:class I SAM-dependent methyltransferase [Desulfurivibrio sp.]
MKANSRNAGATTVAVTAATPELAPAAAELADRLQLPLLAQPTAGSLLLVLTPQRLELHPTATERASPGPLWVDFLSGPLAYRRHRGGGRRQALARAVGLKGGRCPTVIDATAGLGRDGFILAALGCRVQLLERSPIIHALLADGLERALADPATAAIIQQRLTLTLADAGQLLPTLPTPAAQVIYLDPMFPQRQKSALVKKESRLLRQIAGDDPDAEQLLTAALSRAGKRVVVKRPRQAPPLPGPPANFSLSGKSNRFDIYLSKPEPG